MKLLQRLKDTLAIEKSRSVKTKKGQKLLEIVKNKDSNFLKLIQSFKENDIIGSPYIYTYPEVGTISPTTIRDMKVAPDFKKHFGTDIGKKITKIGVGYGGQLLISDRIFSMKEFHLFDLLPVLGLVSKYLDIHILNCSCEPITLNQHVGEDSYDLVISNY